MIRDWRDDDATSLARYANNRKIWSNLRDGFPYPYARDDAVLFISRALQKEPRTVFAIACEYAFNELGFCRIYAEPYTTNPASAHVLEKSGFVLEAILRANVVKDERVLDQFLYARVKQEIDH